MTTTQLATLCDWENGKPGGYGRSVTCSDGSTQITDPNQSTCVSSAISFGNGCPTLTVGDIEDCADAIGTNLCALKTSSGCASFDTCLGY